jgi:hypothetical protein
VIISPYEIPFADNADLPYYTTKDLTVSEAELSLQQSKVSRDWPLFTENLRLVLAGLEEDQFLILTVKRTGQFVQFAGQGSFGMRCETSSNEFISKAAHMDDTQLTLMGKLGWTPPTGKLDEATPENDPDGSPNFHIDCPVPQNLSEIAQRTTDTFTVALRVPHPGFLEYEAFDSDDQQLNFPVLGLKRTQHQVHVDIETLVGGLLSTLQAITGIEDLEFDDDGDIGLTRDDLPVFVRFAGSTPHVRFHTPLLLNIEQSPELLSALNALNAIDSLHVFHREGTLVAFLDIPATPLVPEHIISGLQKFCDDALGIKAWAELEFGGTGFDSTALPSILKH